MTINNARKVRDLLEEYLNLDSQREAIKNEIWKAHLSNTYHTELIAKVDELFDKQKSDYVAKLEKF